MNVRNAIRFVEYSSLIAISGFLLMVLAYVGHEENAGAASLLILIFALIFFAAFLFRNTIVNYQMQHSKYHNLFYFVVNKMHLEEKVAPAKQRRSAISTELQQESIVEFIAKNGLTTNVGRKSSGMLKPVLVYVSFTLLIVFLNQLSVIGTNSAALIFILGVILISFGLLFRNRDAVDLEDTVMSFDTYALHLPDRQVLWKDMIDWQYHAGDAVENPHIVIRYHNAYSAIETTSIDLDYLNINKTDLALLLTVYREKYGTSVY